MSRIPSWAIGGVLILSLLFHAAPSQAASVSLYMEGKAFPSQDVQVVYGRTYVPLRMLSEGLGYDVQWHGHNRVVEITEPGQALSGMALNQDDHIQLYILGELATPTSSEGYPFLDQGRTMVPLRYIVETLGANIHWNAEDQRVEVWQTPPADADELVDVALAAEPTQVSFPSPAPAFGGPQGMAYEASNLTIAGPSLVPLSQMEAYLANEEAKAKARAIKAGKPFCPFPEDIAALYYELGERFGIRGDVALAQAILETGYFQYGNEVVPGQHNYCGLGAIGRITTEADVQKQAFSKVDASRAWLLVNTHGWWYDCPRTGVEAHIQHLYSYASADPIPAGCTLVDGRFQHGNRGNAQVWKDLNGKWAVPGHGYGEKIVEGQWQAMMDYRP